ncbi:MAG: hypothetical protein IKQ17_13365 [Kiritimatiellae bacterium]|nr:hypothetical protein [Kiritimatiellia bacterium]
MEPKAYTIRYSQPNAWTLEALSEVPDQQPDNDTCDGTSSQLNEPGAPDTPLVDGLTPKAVRAAIALAAAAVAREKCKNLVMKSRESGNTCTLDYAEQKIAYTAAKRRFRVCLAGYIRAVSASGNSVI